MNQVIFSHQLYLMPSVLCKGSSRIFFTSFKSIFSGQYMMNKRSAGIMACDNAKISNNSVNAVNIIGEVGSFSGASSGNNIEG